MSLEKRLKRQEKLINRQRRALRILREQADELASQARQRRRITEAELMEAYREDPR